MSKRTMIIIIITMVVVVSLLTGIFVAVVVFSDKADEANTQKAKIYYEQVESNYQNQKYKDSLKALEDLTSKFPNSPYIEEANKKFPDLAELVEKQNNEQDAQGKIVEKKKIEMPKNIKELPPFLDTVLPNEGKGKTIISESSDYPGFYMVICQFEAKDSFFGESSAKGIARDFIFKTYEATYTSNLPVISSTIVINKADGKLGLSTTLGRKIADKSEKGVWSNPNMGPTIFFDWLKTRKNSNPDPSLRCTYLGEYSK